jgi:hypothetical protein
MKKILLGLGLLLTGAFSSNAQGLDGIVVEKFYVSNAADAAASTAGNGGVLPVGSITWRFYVDLAAGWELQSVYGDAAHTLNFSSTTPFYNHEDRGATTANAISFNNIDDNTVILDSYISVGGTCSNRLGVLKSEDDATGQIVFNPTTALANTDPSIGQPVNVRDGQTGVASTIDAVTILNLATELGAVLDNISQAGNALTTNNGAWSNLNGSDGPTANNRILIGQFTTTGVLTYAINIQIRNTTTLQVVNYVSSNPTGAEVTDPSLSGTLNLANTLPTASITAPTTGTAYLVGAPVSIDATATDPDGTITLVEFLVDGNVVGSSTAAGPNYSLSPTWTATVGSHNLTVRATDNLGGQFTSSPAVVILVGAVIAPTVSITSPASGATFVLGDTPTITATANDADGTVSQVEFFVDGISIGVDAGAGPSYSAPWPVVIGNHTITAVATDDDNATGTSAPIAVTVFDSSSAYVIISSTNACSINNFCLPINAIVPVDNVIGYDIVLAYDNAEVLPTGVVTVNNDLINPAYVSTANSINAAAGLMYISVFFNGSAPISAEFNGTGELLCVEFARTAGFGPVDTTSFSVNSLQESYINGVQPKVVSPGTYSTFQESDFNSRLQFWFDGSPIRYDGTATYLITNIYGTDLACANQSVAAVQPDINGEFAYDYSNGPFININKDIPNATSVQPVVNGFDAFLTRRVLINDATFIPSVYQIIAMDVNTDGVVSAGDLSQINQRAVLILGEFQQDWNYSPSGVSNGQPSKDWLFIDGTTLTSDPSFIISGNFPFDDGFGYSKSNVPEIDFCLEVPYQTSATCNSFDLESYTGILIGDINGNFATNATGGPFRLSDDQKVIFDLSKAVISQGYVDVPVVVISNADVNSLDFSAKFNENTLQFAGIVQHNTSLEILSNMNTADRELRFTSYSLQNYDLNTAPVSVRFNTAAEITESDLTSVVAYLNGEQVTAEVIGSRIAGEEVMVNVFPNPANDMVNVISSENANIQIVDANGRVVLALNNMNAYQKYSFNTQDLASGIYLMKVFGQSNVTVKKIVIE